MEIESSIQKKRKKKGKTKGEQETSITLYGNSYKEI